MVGKKKCTYQYAEISNDFKIMSGQNVLISFNFIHGMILIF